MTPGLPDEINPGHPVTRAMRDNWHKLCALVMHKLGQKDVVITARDLERLAAEYDGLPTIIAHHRRDGINLRLLNRTEALEYARQLEGKDEPNN